MDAALGAVHHEHVTASHVDHALVCCERASLELTAAAESLRAALMEEASHATHV